MIIAFGDELSPDELIAKACNSYDNGEACLYMGFFSYTSSPVLSDKYLQKACDLEQKDDCKFLDKKIKNFTIPSEIKSKNKKLVNMILMSQTLSNSEKQECFNDLGIMSDEQKK